MALRLYASFQGLQRTERQSVCADRKTDAASSAERDTDLHTPCLNLHEKPHEHFLAPPGRPMRPHGVGDAGPPRIAPGSRKA